MTVVDQKSVGPEDIFAAGRQLSNWGAWGPDDEKGALNHITAEHRVRAARLVRRGAVFSLALPIKDGSGPMLPYPAGRFNSVHRMTVTGDTRGPLDMGAGTDFTDDMIMMGCQSSTQWDALCHVYYDEKLYNGYPSSSVSNSGAARNSIDKVHTDMVARGVLLDVPRYLGVDALDPGYAVTADELDACAQKQGVEVTDGDVVLFRTGFQKHVRKDDWSYYHELSRPGLHWSTAEWIKDRRIAAIAGDNPAVEAESDVPGVRSPFHMLVLRDMGVHIGEFWQFDELAADCAQDGVYEAMLVAQPLRIEGGAGSPINPLAIK